MNPVRVMARKASIEQLQRKLRNHIAPISFTADWTGGDPIALDTEESPASSRRTGEDDPNEGGGVLIPLKKDRAAG